MRRGAYHAWSVRETDFPIAAGIEQQLFFLLRYAILAPSAHNTQPWQFAIRGNRVRVSADESRALAVSDPSRREMFVSIGCCLTNLLMAAEHFGFRATIEEFPIGAEEAVADLSFAADTSARTSDGDRLFAAIPRRHANRFLFEPRRVPKEVLLKFQSLASSGDPRLDLVDDPAKIQALAEITGKAVSASMGDPKFRAELSRWVRNNFTKQSHGMPGFSVGVPDIPSLLAPLIVKLPPTAKAEAKKRQAQVASSPAVSVISTRGDTRNDWIRSGMLLERLWLLAAAEGLRVGVLAAAVETAEYYKDIQRLLGIDVRPQVFLRLGYGPPDPHPTPRLAIERVT